MVRSSMLSGIPSELAMVDMLKRLLKYFHVFTAATTYSRQEDRLKRTTGLTCACYARRVLQDMRGH
jgi:hypothetical protein